MRARLAAGIVLSGCAAPAAEDRPSVLVSDAGRDAVIRLTASGEELVAGAPRAPVRRPAGQLADGQGLLIANFGHGEVLRCDDDGVRTLYFDPDVLEEPAAIAPAPGGVFVLGNDTRNIVLLGDDGALQQVIADDALRDPHDLLVHEGLLFVATSPQGGLEGTVQVRDPDDGQLLEVWGDRELDAVALAPAPDGRMFVGDWNGRVALVGPEGVETLVELPRVVDLALGPDGALWVLADKQLWRLDPDDGAVLDAPRAGLQWPRALAFEP